MALGAQSLFLYGYTITEDNMFIDFQAVNAGPVLTATLEIGEYSLTSLLEEIASAMNAADPANVYSAAADRTVLGGLQNRVSIGTTGSYLKILFGSGPNEAASVASLIGFLTTDYSGDTTYTGSSTTGTALVPAYIGYNYLNDYNQAKVFGNVNVSAAGIKEAVVFQIQKFIDVEFRYESRNVLSSWQQLFYWLIQQKPFDFTPEISSPGTFYQVTLEKTAYDSKGLGYQMKEMLPNFPNLYQTGPLNFRIVPDVTVQQFIPG